MNKIFISAPSSKDSRLRGNDSMRPLKHALLSVTLILTSFISFAQDEEEAASLNCTEVTNKKAIQLYEKGADKKKHEKKDRMQFLREALELEPDYPDALYLFAEESIKTARVDNTSFKPAEKNLERLIEICPDYNSYAYFYLGQITFGARQYSASVKHFKKFLEDVDAIKKEKDYELANNLIKQAKELADIYEKNVPFNPSPVEDVSTFEQEYLAIISPDNQLMFFTRGTLKKNLDQVAQSDKPVEVFSLSKRTGGKFEKGQPLPYPFNKGDNYGGATVTPDNKTMYVTICSPIKGYNNCDIFTAKFINGKWDTLIRLDTAINTPDGWEAQPTISADGKTLYFASARAESRGIDIYKSVKQPDDTWSMAENLGPSINTDGNEKSPFIHSDSQTLYFSSDGHTGVGGYDIFMVRADSSGKWKKPKNIGYPINSEGDEVGFFVSTDGKYGYFASNSIKGNTKGGYDIYSFDLYMEARPEKVMLVKGEVKNEAGEVVQGAKVQFKNTETKKITEFETDANDGKYVAIVSVQKGEDYVVTVKSDGMAFSSQLISSKDNNLDNPPVVSAALKPIEVGMAYRLNNINYGVNSAKLTSESLTILDELIAFLKENPTIKIAIHGHTDDVGKDADNLALSSDRAFSVMGYLQDNGITGERLAFKGFGKTKPLVPNTSEANRALNRRTEFVITEK